MISKVNIIKNVSSSIFANVFSALVSLLLVMIIPKYATVEDYGTWQLLLFYFSYIGVTHFGWLDGMYLRYAGCSYRELDRKKLAGQVYGIAILQIIISLLVFFFTHIAVLDGAQRKVLLCLSTIIPFLQLYYVFTYILQITNRIIDYAKVVIFEKAILLLAGLFVVFVGDISYIKLYFMNLISVVSSCILGGIFCKELLIPNFYSFKEIIDEAKNNISVGWKLLVFNISQLLILGIVRYGIAYGWDVSTFGKVSLVLSMCNFFMLFINAIAIVLFPILKNMSGNQIPVLYRRLRFILSTIILTIFIFYYPIRLIVSAWLPRYKDSLIYMVILLPIILFSSKNTLLINNCFKSLRHEATMAKISFWSMFISLLLTLLGVLVFHNLTLTVFFMVVVYAINCLMGEYHINKILNTNSNKETVIELTMILIFILTGFFINNWMCTLIYGLSLGVYYITFSSKIKEEVSSYRETKNAAE